MSVKIIQDVIMTLSGSSNWEKRECFLGEEGGTYMEWTTYFRPPGSSWRLTRESVFTGVSSGEGSPGVMVRGLCMGFENHGRQFQATKQGRPPGGVLSASQKVYLKLIRDKVCSASDRFESDWTLLLVSVACRDPQAYSCEGTVHRHFEAHDWLGTTTANL